MTRSCSRVQIVEPPDGGGKLESKLKLEVKAKLKSSPTYSRVCGAPDGGGGLHNRLLKLLLEA